MCVRVCVYVCVCIGEISGGGAVGGENNGALFVTRTLWFLPKKFYNYGKMKE